MDSYDNFLICQICDYKSKQLHQHLKAIHNISVNDYRQRFGQNVLMQINTNPPINKKPINIKLSNYTKQSYINIKEKLKSIVDLYNPTELKNILLDCDYYEQYIGYTKDRTLLKNDPKLYKSIYLHTDILLRKFKNVKLVERMKFIMHYDCDIEKLKCECGKTYTFNKYCRYCPEPKKTFLGKNMTPDIKLKIRLSTIDYIIKCKGKIAPRYNVNSIPIIEDYGKKHNYNFLHAENGGEFHIKELGYFVDAYDKDKNVVLEIDEKHHYIDNVLCDRDIRRQKEIENFLNCTFIRIKI